MSAVLLEVVSERRGVCTDLAAVDSLATGGQEEQAVELLEQDGRRLMDGAQDGLATVSKLPHQGADRPSSLRVETGSGFVQEKKKLRLRGKLDGNRQTLALLDIKTFTKNTTTASAYSCMSSSSMTPST